MQKNGTQRFFRKACRKYQQAAYLMKSVCFSIALILISMDLLAQVEADSHSRKASIQNESTKLLDSLNSLASLNHIRDSLTILAWSDSLRNKISHRYSTDFFNRYSDSLRALGVPESAIKRRTDSLVQAKTALLGEVEEKQNKLQRKVTDRYGTWTASLRKNFNLDSAGVSMPGANLKANMPNLPGGSPAVPAVTGMPDIPEIPSLGAEDFSSLGVSPELSQIGGSMTLPSGPQLGEWQKSLPTMPDLAGEASKYGDDLKEVTNNPSAAAEKSLSNVSEVSEATKMLNEAEKQTAALKAAEQLKDPSTAAEELKQQAVDHFAGKEAEVKSAMNVMAKYKKKYASLGSLSEIKKHDWLPINGLKGKPFKERFRLGMNLGFKGAGDTLLFDFYPNAAYRITGRIEAGLGANYRVRVIQHPFGFDQRDPVWGMSTFVILKTFKSVNIRVEMDGSSFPVSGSAERAPYRDWRWSFYTGVQTNFKISKRWTGNVQMLYNFDSSLKDGFPEKLSARLGVQYSLK
jgi:hypothetical protein